MVGKYPEYTDKANKYQVITQFDIHDQGEKVVGGIFDGQRQLCG